MLNLKDRIKKDNKKNSKKQRRNKRAKMSTFVFYVELIFSMLAKGNVDKPENITEISDSQFYYATNKIFTKNKIKKPLFIQELPMELPSGFIRELKREVSHLGEINVIYRINPYDLNLNSWSIKNKILIWKRKMDAFEKETGSRSSSDEIFSDQETRLGDKRTKWMIDSWKWVYDSINKKDNFCKFNMVLELIADNLNNLYSMESLVKHRLKILEIQNSQIMAQTNEYYKAYSPAGNVERSMLTKLANQNIVTDRTISRLFDVSHGLVGDEKGLYFGTDVLTALPITYDMKKGSDAMNFMLTAATGEGKSNYSKGLLTHLEIEDFSSIYVDYEGDEYTDVGIAHGSLFVNMSPESSSYFDTVEIGDLTGDLSIDKGLKNEAITATKLVFDILTDYKEGMNFYEESLYNDMVNRSYKKYNVTEDMNSWKNSKGMSFKDLYNELLLMKEEEEYKEQHKQIFDFITKLRLFFEEDGIYSGIFKNKVSVNEILKHKRVIFSFGMKGKTENTIDKRSLALRQLFVGYLIILKSNYNKTVENRSTVVLLEELQRYLGHKSSGQMVNDIISGGRKRNMITFLVTNSPLQIMDVMDSSDKSEIAEHAKAIKNNIQGLIVGRLQDETSRRIAEAFNIPECLPEMELINKDENFKYCFLMHYKGESTILKFEIPPSLQKSSMYVTRVDQEDSKNVKKE